MSLLSRELFGQVSSPSFVFLITMSRMAYIQDFEFGNAMNSHMLQEDMGYVVKVTKSKSIAFEQNPELLERGLDRIKRTELKSGDGLTAEIYDQFYRDHQLLLKLFLILGVMPVVRSAPGRVTFKWRSNEMVYAFIFYIFTSALVVRVGYERIKILQTTKEFDEYIYAIIFIIFLVPHFWIPYVGWGVANHVAHYKTMWGSFQVFIVFYGAWNFVTSFPSFISQVIYPIVLTIASFENCVIFWNPPLIYIIVRYYRVTGTTLTFPKLRIYIIILFIGCVLLSVIYLYCLSQLLEGFLLWHTTAYFHIITMINMNAALFFINTKAIKRASDSLAICFKRDVKFECTPKLISQYRLLWLNLSEILQALGNSYARTYSTYCLFMSINITIGSYGALSEIFDSGFSLKVLGLVVLTFYCAALLFIICDCAHSSTSSVAEGVQNTLLTVDLLRVETQTQREIDLFISAIELNPPVVSMQGYGLINRELITATISTIAIYLIVLLQFKLSLLAEKALKSSFSTPN